MKKLVSLLLLIAFISSSYNLFAQKKIKEGIVKFELVDSEESSPEMAMLGGTTMDFYFTEKTQKMDMSMMGGMMRIQTVVQSDSPKDSYMLMDMMGQKMHIVEISEEELGKSNQFMNLDGMNSVVYDEKDQKTIAGYKCYSTNVIMDGGTVMKYYITEKIAPPIVKGADKSKALKGYPLEMKIEIDGGLSMVFRAIEVKEQIDKSDFQLPKGYKKMTMAEFQKEMGGMNFGF